MKIDAVEFQNLLDNSDPEEETSQLQEILDVLFNFEDSRAILGRYMQCHLYDHLKKHHRQNMGSIIDLPHGIADPTQSRFMYERGFAVPWATGLTVENLNIMLDFFRDELKKIIGDLNRWSPSQKICGICVNTGENSENESVTFELYLKYTGRGT